MFFIVLHILFYLILLLFLHLGRQGGCQSQIFALFFPGFGHWNDFSIIFYFFPIGYDVQTCQFGGGGSDVVYP